jgi:hypothetical protein
MEQESVIRVVAGGDQLIVREGIVHALQEAGFDVIGVVADADEFLHQLQALDARKMYVEQDGIRSVAPRRRPRSGPRPPRDLEARAHKSAATVRQKPSSSTMSTETATTTSTVTEPACPGNRDNPTPWTFGQSRSAVRGLVLVGLDELAWMRTWMAVS